MPDPTIDYNLDFINLDFFQNWDDQAIFVHIFSAQTALVYTIEEFLEQLCMIVFQVLENGMSAVHAK